ncbi:serine aminopeptidase domain-containing protein [Singulisphaera sp. PoT]|uniref:serine aminopeptidase domain-containing protein n=1 Tax=Singulisphaera sp. PoT TaxID=3411797 RepID=UPI003BF47429
MLYSTMLKGAFRRVYGEPPDLSFNGKGEGLVLVADGVGGLDLCGTGLRYVMGALRLPMDVRVVNWGHGFGRWHADLTNVKNRDRRAKEIVEAVIAYRAEHPGRPVFLVGKSGGTGLVVKALEHLPEDAVEAVVLLAPALSPRYDLSRALLAVRRDVTVFWSPLDVVVLGLGTSLFGTIDRRRSVSAGMVGFRIPKGLDEAGRARYAKLRQVRWRPRMASTGYLGGHVGPDSPAFLKKYVVPLLRVADAPHC